MVDLRINGRDHRLDADGDMPLLWALRDILGLQGTKYGCGVGLCGACTVHVNGEARFACQTTIEELVGVEVLTIEAMEEHAVGKVVQQAWVESDVVQCGYCQPGQIMRAVALLNQHPKPSAADLDEAMSANVCRCGCYVRIRAAIEDASRSLSA